MGYLARRKVARNRAGDMAPGNGPSSKSRAKNKFHPGLDTGGAMLYSHVVRQSRLALKRRQDRQKVRKMANLVRNTPQMKAEKEKGGSYIRLYGDQLVAFRSLMRDLGFNPDAPREDAGVKKVGEMIAGLGLDLARALLVSGTESLAEYVEKVKAGDEAEAEAADEAPAEVDPKAEPKK